MNIPLTRALGSWPGSGFGEAFCAEVEASAAQPPMQRLLIRAMTQGSQLADRAPQVMILSSRQEQDRLKVKAGVFFHSVTAGCNCADDPSPPDEHNEYCELNFVIDTGDGNASVELV